MANEVTNNEKKEVDDLEIPEGRLRTSQKLSWFMWNPSESDRPVACYANCERSFKSFQDTNRELNELVEFQKNESKIKTRNVFILGSLKTASIQLTSQQCWKLWVITYELWLKIFSQHLKVLDFCWFLLDSWLYRRQQIQFFDLINHEIRVSVI